MVFGYTASSFMACHLNWHLAKNRTYKYVACALFHVRPEKQSLRSLSKLYFLALSPTDSNFAALTSSHGSMCDACAGDRAVF